MVPMVARAIASRLVLVLVEPSVVTVACELRCAMGRHHHGTPHHQPRPATTIKAVRGA
jgi:hypothetical protein